MSGPSQFSLHIQIFFVGLHLNHAAVLVKIESDCAYINALFNPQETKIQTLAAILSVL